MSTLVAPPAFGDFTRLDDEMVKLVAYTIVSLLRDKEMILPEGKDQILVTESITPERLVADLISQYVEKKNYLPDITEDQWLEHRRYLRVYYVVSQRWPKEPLKYEERQIKALEEIRDRM